MSKTIRILLLDDHSIFLNGIKGIIEKDIENTIISYYYSVKEIDHAISNFDKYDILISDLEIPGEDTYRFLEKVKKTFSIPILVVTMHKKIAEVNRCKKIGINNYILKSDNEFFSTAIQETLLGKPFYSPEINFLINSSVAKNKLVSERQKEILKLMCLGYSNKEIAEELFLSVETIKTHKKNIKYKLGLNNNRDIFNYARKNILIQ